MKKIMKIFLWIVFFPIMYSRWMWKSEVNKIGKVFSISIVWLFFICAYAVNNIDAVKNIKMFEDDYIEEVEEKENKEEIKEEVKDWKAGLSEELVKEIEDAFKEIGEKPEYIISIEHVKDIETDLFVRREYKLCFDKGNIIHLFNDDKKHFINAVEWRLTTEEWNEGEPEAEEHPGEHLVTIKFWYDDDSTNILQWSHTDNGELQ